MNHFQFIDVKPSIDRNMVNSIKEAIFNRAKAKSNEIASQTNENYTSETKNDVMDIARESFQNTSLNPFNQFIENVGVNNAGVNNAGVNTVGVNKKPDIQPTVEEPVVSDDLEQTYTKEIKRNIESVSNQTFVNSVQDETMAVARKQFTQGTNLTMCLNFLNTQAAIKMTQSTKSKMNFDILG